MNRVVEIDENAGLVDINSPSPSCAKYQIMILSTTWGRGKEFSFILQKPTKVDTTTFNYLRHSHIKGKRWIVLIK